MKTVDYVRKPAPVVARRAPARQAFGALTQREGSRLMPTKPGCACGGGCPRCRIDQDRATGQLSGFELKLAERESTYERRAERIADEVMDMPAPTPCRPGPSDTAFPSGRSAARRPSYSTDGRSKADSSQIGNGTQEPRTGLYACLPNWRPGWPH